MKRKLLFVSSLFLLLGLMVYGAFSASSISRIRGSFEPNTSWSGGHPGRVLFDIAPVSTGYTATRDQDGYLSGFFWLGNVGWATFSQTDAADIPLCRPRIVCPSNILQNPYQECPVHGCAWSENAGWIIMSGSMIDSTYTGVYYNPATTLIEGWGWSESLGWVPFYAKTATEIATNATVTGVTMDGISVNFVGRIAIIGNIAGTRIFDLPDQNVGYVFTTAKHSTIMNTLRQNIALMSRNITGTGLDITSPFSFYIHRNSDYEFRTTDVWPYGKRSIIVIGHDLILDTANSIGDINDQKPRALIVLKDEAGNGGNVIISDKVKEIYSMIYAEGSIFSGEKTSTGLLDIYLSHGAWNIPQKQLYIKGLLISKNTIGGARQTPVVCPVVVDTCDVSTAEFYDLNYFRTFDPTDPTQRAGGYTDPRLDNASMIIEYNQAILSDPPPGIENTIK